MRLLQQSSTAQPLVFLMIDSADHISGKAGLAPTVTLSKAGAAFGAPAGAVSEIANGWYKVAPSATDTDTPGTLILHASAAGADPVDMEYQVVAFNPLDAAGLGLSRLDATVGSRSTYAGGAVASVTAPVTVGTNNDKTGYQLAANQDVRNVSGTITDKTGYALAVAPPTAGEVATAVWAAGSRTLSSFGTLIADIWGNAARTITGTVTVGTNNDKSNYSLAGGHGLATEANQVTILARLGAWTGTGINTLLGAFKALLSKAASAPSDIGGTFDPVTDSVEAIRDTAPMGTAMRGTDNALLAGSYTAPDNAGVAAVQAVINKLDTALEQDLAVYRFTANALEQVAAGSGLSAQEVRDAMKLAPTAGAPAAGSVDQHLDDLATADETAQAVKSALAPSTAFYVVSPVLASAVIVVVPGCDYYAADSQALTWTDPYNQWPDLTGASIALTIGSLIVDLAGSVLIASGTGKKVQVEMARTTSALLTRGTVYDYALVATLASGHRVALIPYGRCQTVRALQ